MKKKLCSMFIVSSLVLSGIPVLPQTANAAEVGEIVRGVNFRTGPSTSEDRIRSLREGETVTILDEVNRYWYKVKDNDGRTGYVSSNDKYIEVSEINTNHSASANATIVRSVSFRNGPSTKYSRMRYLQDGERVTILEEANRYWYKVRDSEGHTGYVSSNSKYIATEYEEEAESTTNARVVRSVSFRSGPSTQYSRMRYLSKNEDILVLAEVNSYWYKVQDQDGNVGYASSSEKYIQMNGEVAEPSKPAISARVSDVIKAGKAYMGTPYEFGSNRSSTLTFDCSDFVRRIFIEGAGLTLPSNSRTQARYVKDVRDTTTNWEHLKPGDLMFFMAYKGTSKSKYAGIHKASQRITHVSIYLGDGKMLHTYSNKSGGVRIDSIDNRHWEYRFVFGGSAM